MDSDDKAILLNLIKGFFSAEITHDRDMKEIRPSSMEMGKLFDDVKNAIGELWMAEDRGEETERLYYANYLRIIQELLSDPGVEVDVHDEGT